MRLFTKLRAEQISTIAYPLPVAPADQTYSAETRSSSAVAQANPQTPAGQTTAQYPQTVRAADGTGRIVNNQAEMNSAQGLPTGQKGPTNYNYDLVKTNPSPVKTEPEVEQVVITTIHRESYQSPKSDLLLSPKVADRKDPEGPIVGDWYVTDYDIMTDKVIRKVYDNETFVQYFKASLGG